MATLELLNAEAVILGTEKSARLQYYTKDANANMSVLDLSPGGSVHVPVFAVGMRVMEHDLGLFDGLTQPGVFVIDADRDSYVGFHYSADDTPVVRLRAGGAGTVRNHTLPDVASDTFTLNAATQTLTNKTLNGANITLNDDDVFHLGTDSDQAFVSRSTALAANTALTNVLAGTPVSAATPANSLLISNITANGDIAIFALLGGTNSTEVFRVDTSVGLMVFNEAGADWDVRFEADSNANLLHLDAGLLGGVGSIGLGGLAVNDPVYSVSVNFPAWTSVTNRNTARFAVMSDNTLTIPAGTVPWTATMMLTEPNLVATGTITNAATLFIANIPTEGSIINASILFGEDVAHLIVVQGQTTAATAGDSLTMRAGAGNTTGTGGAVGLVGGIGGNDAIGGDATLTAGAAGGGNHNGGSVVLTPGALAGTGAIGSVHIRDTVMMDERTETSITTDSDVVYTAAQVRTGIINRSGITANRNDSMPTAANLVAGIPGAAVGTSFYFVLNNNDDAQTLTMTTASSGITYDGNTAALAAGASRLYLVIITNVTGASEAATVYGL